MIEALILANGIRFTSLAEVNEWALRTQPATVRVVASGTIHTDPTVFTYAPPGGLWITGGKWVGDGEGFWLSYQPEAPAAGVGWLHVSNVTVARWGRGGIEVSPTVGGDKYGAGYGAWLGVVTVEGARFLDLGHKTPQAWSENRYGVAGVLVRGVRSLLVTGSRFHRLINTDLTDVGNGPALIHAVYVREFSRATVAGCEFKRISGDPVRVSNGATVKVTGSSGKLAGERAFVSDWHTPDQAPSRVSLSGNKPSTLFNGAKSLKLWSV